MSDDANKSVSNSPLAQLTTDELDWQSLSSDWQSQPVPKTDIAALIKQTRRRVLLGKSILALDIVSTIALIIFYIYALVAKAWTFATYSYIAFGCVISVWFCIYTVKFRIRAWQQQSQSPDKAIANALANCESSLKYLKVCKLSVYLLLPAVNWYIYELSKVQDLNVLDGYAFSNGLLVVMWGAFEYYYRKRVKEYIHLTSLITK